LLVVVADSAMKEYAAGQAAAVALQPAKAGDASPRLALYTATGKDGLVAQFGAVATQLESTAVASCGEVTL
jgi:hypothetical protein